MSARSSETSIAQPILLVALLMGLAPAPSSANETDGYSNRIVVSVHPARPITRLHVTVMVEGDYGVDEPWCQPAGATPESPWRGEHTINFKDWPGEALDRSRSLFTCAYFSHSYYGPIYWDDFWVQDVIARDDSGKAVPVQVCIQDWSADGGSEPFPDGCVDACGDAACDGGEPTGTDALQTLLASVGAADCPLRICDIDGDGTVGAADALSVLGRAVGRDLPLLCPPGPTYACFDRSSPIGR